MPAWLARLFLTLNGWHAEGERPTASRYVLIAAPHTSNWDFAYTLALATVFNMRIRWMGKHTLFRFPFGLVMRRLGGIPIRRGRRNDIVRDIAADFRHHEELALIVPAEGTRSRVDYWRSGFYHIARQAGVPIVLGYLDYARKCGGFGPALTPTGLIRAFYADKTGKHPQRFGPVRLKDET